MVCKKLLVVMGIFVFTLMVGFVSAVPQLTIHSPQNITYNSTKILVNVTSDEVVDFFFRNERTGRNVILAENTTHFEDYIYARKGGYEFVVWANDSSGEVNESVNFSTSVSNPVHITSCGRLYSSDAEYVLDNDISDNFICLRMDEITNISLDLMGNTVSTVGGSGIIAYWSSNVEIYNGSINGSPICVGGGRRPYVLDIEGSKFVLRDLNISGFIGISTWPLDSALFENVFVNSSIGLWADTLTEVYFVNTTFVWNGVSGGSNAPTSSGIWAWSSHLSLILEGVTIEGFHSDIYLDGSYNDFFLRNTNINLSNIHYPRWASNTRFYTQHKILINVTDQFNETGSGVIEVTDNGILLRETGIDAMLAMVANPTSNLLIATEDDGTTEFWLTEKLTTARVASPLTITEYDFSDYNLTARTWDNITTVKLNLTDHHSTIPVDIKVTVPAVEELDSCTITQMLDLNNDEVVNIQDAIIVLRVISGQNVSISGTSKGCEGINLNPF